MAQAPIIVKKFGGTSVGSIERIEAVASRVAHAVQKGQAPVLAVSAMSGETNRLISLAYQVDPSYRGPAYDMLVASGEQVSIALLAMALEKRGISARPLLAYQLGIQTDSIFSKARIQSVNGAFLVDLCRQGVVPIVAGFQGIDEEFQITTLGRGGSDTTAVALAAAICEETREKCVCEIFTDVTHVYSADPRLVKTAKKIKKLSFEEMMEMAALGSKILHVRCVELAAKYQVPIQVRSSFIEEEGTWIGEEESGMENPVVSAVTHEANTAIFKLFPVPFGPGFLAELFAGLADKGVVVDIITQSQNEEGQRLAFSISNEDIPLAEKYIQQTLSEKVELVKLSNMAKISVVGVGMRNHPGVASRFFKCLDRLDVPVHIVTTSEIKISAVFDGAHLEKSVNAIHKEFGLDQ
jgi:aspartate kinase